MSLFSSCVGGSYYRRMMDLKCGSVTGSSFMARFDLNHPYRLHCGQEKSDETIYVVHQRALTWSASHKANWAEWTDEGWSLTPASPKTCIHHGNAWKKPSPLPRLFCLSHFPCFWDLLLPWKQCFLPAKCQTDLLCPTGKADHVL